MLQKYVDEKYDHDHDEPHSNMWLWIGLIVGSLILIIAMFRLAIHLNRRMQWMRNHFGDFIKWISIIIILFFVILFGGIRLLNIGTKEKNKTPKDET